MKNRFKNGALFSFFCFFVFLSLIYLSPLNTLEAFDTFKEVSKKRLLLVQNAKNQNVKNPQKFQNKQIEQSKQVQRSRQNKNKNRMSCSKDELKNKDCFLKAFSYKIFLTKKKLRLSNGIWRSLVAMPEYGSEVEWHRIRFVRENRRLFLEFLLWGLQGYGKVQNLHWDIYEIQGVKTHLVLSEIVQKRRKDVTQWRTRNFIHDEKESFGLKPQEGGKIQWFVESRSGEF